MSTKVKVQDIKPNPFYARTEVDPHGIEALAAEIETEGLSRMFGAIDRDFLDYAERIRDQVPPDMKEEFERAVRFASRA